jgi:hypothetical protein
MLVSVLQEVKKDRRMVGESVRGPSSLIRCLLPTSDSDFEMTDDHRQRTTDHGPRTLARGGEFDA